LAHHIATADAALDLGVAATIADPEPAGRPIPRDPDALLFAAEMAYLLGLSVRTLESLRLRGGGPAYIKLGRAVRYNRLRGLEWAERQIRRSTSDPGSSAGAR